jgi:hypothetical protein
MANEEEAKGPASETKQPKPKRRTKRKKRRTSASNSVSESRLSKYPRHSVEKSLRIAKAILEQNAGKPCTVRESAKFVGVAASGPYRLEVSSGIKFGFLARSTSGQIEPTERAKRVLRPQDPQDKLGGLRDAVLEAPLIQDVYGHYRGENLPDATFFNNALVDTFKIPADKVSQFQEVFIDSLRAAELISEHEGKTRVLDVSHGPSGKEPRSPVLKKLEKTVKVDASDSCFVMMPFASPLGDYYAQIYKPAIEKAGLKPLRADADIFKTGKIIDQIWSGINAAKVLVAELTTRNPNVFYELGLAHALQKPVVLVSSNEDDVPFDLKHIRIIYYDVMDPFWGNKLMDKVAENILSAIEKPGEAMLQKPA